MSKAAHMIANFLFVISTLRIHIFMVVAWQIQLKKPPPAELKGPIPLGGCRADTPAGFEIDDLTRTHNFANFGAHPATNK